MSHIALQIMVGTALTDTKFCEGLLNGSRPLLVNDFDLTKEERQAVLGISAMSIQEFAAQLCDWLETWASPDSPPSASPQTVVRYQLPPDRFGSWVNDTAGSVVG
jgi:hypothetical protein